MLSSRTRRPRLPYSALTFAVAFLLAIAVMPFSVQAWARPTSPATSREAEATKPVTGDDATIWYLAEGYTGGDFDTWVLVQNPGDTTAKVTLDFQLSPGASAPSHKFDLPGGARKSIHLDELPGLGATDVSTRVVSSLPVVAERAMYFNYNGKTGGHDSIGVKYPSAVWYLAEGYTGGDFDTYVLVQNPGSSPTGVTLDFQLPAGASAPSYTLNLPANTRKTIHLDELPGLGATDVSTKVSSQIPVVAERAVYFNYNGKDGGHDSVGVENPDTNWYLAEGYTGGDFDTYVLVQNPGKEAAKVTLDFQLNPGSSAPSYGFDLPANTRKTVHLDELPGLASTDVSTHVTSDKGVVAERAVYFNYNGKTDGHNSPGVSRPNCDWYLAEGYTANDFDTYVLVQNPGKTDKKVTLHFQLNPGSKADPYSFDLPGGTRKTIHLDTLPGLGGTDVSTWVDASGPVVAERAMYFTYDGKDGGTCSTGATYDPPVLPETTKVLADSDMKHLINIHDIAGNKRVFTFDASTANLSKIDVGDVIISAAGTHRIPPFKVTAIKRSGGNLLITARGAAVEETILRGRVSMANSAVAQAAGAGDRNAASLAHFEVNKSVNVRVPNVGSNYVEFKGSATVGADLDFAMDIDFTWPSIDYKWKTKWGIKYLTISVNPPSASLKSTSFGASFTEKIGVDVTVHGDFNINNFVSTIPGTKIELPSLDFVIGVVPVWIDPYIQLAIGIDGSLHTQITAGATQHAQVGGGVTYDQATGWNTNKSMDFGYDLRPPAAVVYNNSDCTMSFGPQLGALVYSFAGPYVNVMPGFRLTLDRNDAHPGNPLWAEYATLDIYAGVKVVIYVGILDWEWSLSIVDKRFNVWHKEELLAQSVRIYSLSANSGAVGDSIDINGTGFGSDRPNGSNVSFGDVQASEYGSWKDDKINCKVPTGVSGQVDVSATHIFHDWNIFGLHLVLKQTSNKKPFNVAGPPPPPPVGQELLTNGNFSGGLANWSVIDQGGTNYHGTNSTQVKSEGGVPILFMYRRCPQNDGGSAGVAQGLNALLQGSGLNLTARIRCDYQRGGAIAGSNPAWYPEGAVQFRIKFRRANGSTGEWYHGFYYGSVPGADLSHFTQVAKGSWVDYASGNILPKIGAGSTITQFRIYGFGWDFDGYASGVSLKTS